MNLKKIIIPSIIMILIDIIFLSNFASYLGKMIEEIQSKEFSINYPPAIACYIMLIFSYYYFIINKNGSTMDAFILGFVIYSIYETTNMATIKGWKMKAVVYDSLWGGTLFLLTKIISDLIESHIK